MRAQLNQWKHAKPFRPFVISTKDGRSFSVKDSDAIFVPPKSQWVYVGDSKGHADPVFVSWITDISALDARARKPRRKAG